MTATRSRSWLRAWPAAFLPCALFLLLLLGSLASSSASSLGTSARSAGRTCPAVAGGRFSLPLVPGLGCSLRAWSSPSFFSARSLWGSTGRAAFWVASCTLTDPAEASCLPSYSQQQARDAHRLVLFAVVCGSLLVLLLAAALIVLLGR
ncbi:MAG: hypothetical protein JWO22_2023 [Frankiales bacterium]|nr:hypothetical protein [Frankiales bacterium]